MRATCSGGSSGGFHLRQWSQALDGRGVEEQVVRRHFAGDANARLPCAVDGDEIVGCGHMADVHALPMALGGLQRPGDHRAIGVDGDGARSGPGGKKGVELLLVGEKQAAKGVIEVELEPGCLRCHGEDGRDGAAGIGAEQAIIADGLGGKAVRLGLEAFRAGDGRSCCWACRAKRQRRPPAPPAYRRRCLLCGWRPVHEDARGRQRGPGA